MKKRIQHGFTLYELLITCLILGVILVMGVPNMVVFTKNSRMTSTANDLLSAFQRARNESARAKAAITICASANPFTAPACDGTWNQGYIIFTDDNVNGVDDASDGNIAVDAGEAVLYAEGPVADGVSIAAANGATYFSYAATGLGRGDVNGPALSQVMMCDERGNASGPGGDSTARLFVATPLGRATIVRDKARVTQALIDTGLPCP
jgi:type IV fimbrial biogenesis protein FimT